MVQAKVNDNTHKQELRRRMRIMLICLLILFGGIFIYKMVMGLLLKHYMSSQSRVVTVSTMKVGVSNWQPKVDAAGSLRAIHGVNVTTELAGMVQTVYFKPGADVKAGDVLVQLNADNDIALLHSLQANSDLARTTFNRDKLQYKIEGVSKQVVDNDAANLQSLLAQVAQQAAIVEKKTIRAPFTGRLGINLINLGQYVNPGDAIAMLQTLDPIYVDFFVPQQYLPRLALGQAVQLTVDGFNHQEFKGKVTTVNPGVDPATRNLTVEATIANPKRLLLPGMFATVNVDTGEPEKFITLPQTAIFYNSYGDIVYVVEEDGKNKNGEPKLVAKQRFVQAGDTRGEQVTILKGLKEGDTIVSSGQLKLKNGSEIAVNNTVAIPDSPDPDLPNSH
jgi:membrane fusion protein (multidrug efflux system)